AANMITVLGSASGLNQYGTTLSVTVNNVSPLQVFFVKVQGADGSLFGTGAYALTLNFGSGASPTVTPPNTQLADGSPVRGGGGLAETADTDSPSQPIDGFAPIVPQTPATTQRTDATLSIAVANL